MNKNKLVILIAIIMLGFFLRVYKLSSLSMYGDELTLVGDSYSLLKTGKDQLGETFPITFRMGAGRPAGYVYATIPFVALFGPTAIGVRALSVLSGVLLIYLMYLFGKKLFNERVGLFTAFLASISPFGLNLSRGGFEANFALLLTAWGTYLFLDYKKKPINLLLTALLWGLAINTYPTYKVVLPLFLILLVLLTGGLKAVLKVNKKLLVCTALVVISIICLTLGQTFFGIAETRFKNINMFSNLTIREQIVQNVNFDRTHSLLQGRAAELFYNKPIEYLALFIDNYLQNYSTAYLFLTGDSNPRHNMTQSGILFWGEFITLFYGLYLLSSKEKEVVRLLVGWLLLAAIATAMVAEPQTLRNSFMLPPLLLVSAFGFVSFYHKFKLAGTFLFIVLVFQFAFLYHRQVYLSPVKQAHFWSYPAQIAAKFAYQQRQDFDYVFISDRINDVEYAYQVYNKIDPNQIIASNVSRIEVKGYMFKKIEGVHIGQIPKDVTEDFLKSLSGSALFIGDWDINDKYLTEIHKVNSPDGNTAFVYKNKTP